MSIQLNTFFLENDPDATLQHRIKRAVVEGILSGRYRPGERMPSSRALAKHLDISRITVTIAYTDLVADDYLVARGRSGYFVSDTAPSAPRFEVQSETNDGNFDWGRILSHRPPRTLNISRPYDWQSYPYPFIYGQSDPSLFDHQNWRLCALQALGQRDFTSLTLDQYERDDPKLIEYIQRHKTSRRGIRARPENILITMGAQHALWITAQLLLTQRRIAVIENPGYRGFREILGETRCRVVEVDVDEKGLPPDSLPEQLDVVFATPSHHSPTNATMPMDRRKRLLELAEECGFVIVEDDYEFELAFNRSPSPTLKSLDQSGCVVYIGSFSKSLFPGLRLGFIIGPTALIEQARALRSTMMRHPPWHIQRNAANFMSLGHYNAQINRMRKAFQRRRQIMETAIEQNGLTYAVPAQSGGSCFWMKAPDHVDTEELAMALRSRGVVIEPGHSFYARGSGPKNRYRLAYSSISSAKIPKGIELIAEEIARLD